jgi:hypothetical protein
MIAGPAGLLLAAALLVQETDAVGPGIHIDHQGEFGWRCSAPVAIGRYEGSVWRDYDRKRGGSVYTMQIELPESDNRHSLIWAVDPRPEGSEKLREWPNARREVEAFRFGPGYAQVDFKLDAEVAGALWIHYWGNGAYAGSDLRLSARQVRRFVGKGRRAVGIGANVSPAVIAKLASTRRWTAILVDSTGKRLDTEVFEVPIPEEAEMAFRKARAAIDSLESRFRIDHRPRSEGGGDCFDHPDPNSEI